MAGSWWRLLAAFLLILLAALLHAQGAPLPQPFSTTDSRLQHFKPGTIPAAVPEYPSNYSLIGETLPHSPGPQAVGLPQFARSAAMIFSGTVSSISRSHSLTGQGYTAVTFKVAQAIRGTAAGQNLTIHEWAGLWSAGERYRVGERVLLFLYPPSRLGLTSPISGGTGRFAVNSKGGIALTSRHMQMLAGDPIFAGKSVVRFDDLASEIRGLRGVQ